jgi:hypothetical protein
MSTRGITPRLADRFCLLAVSQLEIQAARSVALDGGALGVMAVDAAIGTIIIGAGGAYGLWIVALFLLVSSLGVAVRTLLGPGAKQNGPSVVEMLDDREGNDDETIEENLLKDLADDVQINERTLARKDPMIAVAVALLVLAIMIELAGRL